MGDDEDFVLGKAASEGMRVLMILVDSIRMSFEYYLVEQFNSLRDAFKDQVKSNCLTSWNGTLLDESFKNSKDQMDTLSNNLKELKNTLQNISDLQKRTTRGVNMAEKGSVRVPHFKSAVRNNSPPTVPETNEMPAEVAAEDVQAALDAVPM